MLLLEDKRTIDYQIFLNFLKGKNPKAVLLLQLRNWLFSVLKFDPNTGDPLLSDITSFLDKVSGIIPFNKEEIEEINNNKFDWLYKSLSYNRRSLLYLLGSPRNEIIRSHERMNIYQAREIDSAGIMEISRRPGRTVKEKVAVKPTILAVKREQGADTLENRLLKKYLLRLVNVLDERQKCFDELENEDSTLSRLYSVIRRWVKSEEADRIGKWQNLPPNNILLHDKNYRKIWRGWQFLLDLDEMILNDWNDIDRLLSVYIFWKTLSILQSKGSKILQSPLKFDYNKFEICNIPFEFNNCVRVEAENFALEMKGNKITVISKEGEEHFIEIHFDKLIIENEVKSGALVTLSEADEVSRKLAKLIDKISEKRTIAAGFEEEQKYAAINFSEFPYKAVSVSNSDNFESRDFSTYLTRQFWTANTETDWINLETSNSPASYSEKLNNFQIETVSFEDVFFDSEEHMLSKEKLSSAAYDFMNSIRAFYNTNTLYYLLPDYKEDFSLSRIRSTANTVFPSANPVPYSIGTVFAFHKSGEFKKLSLTENDFVFVIAKSNDNTVFSITPIQAKTTFELSNHKIIKLSDNPNIPYGIRWEHHPSVIIENYAPEKVMEYIRTTVSETEGVKNAKKIVIISGQESIEKARLELPNKNWFFFNKAFEPSEGAAYCADIQEKVKEIQMWVEHLPNLQMSVIQNGRRDFINLTNGKTVLPIRGRAQELYIEKEFTLNKNVREYHFRLIRGDGEKSSTLKYEACLSNSAFPLKNNVTCKLQMNYTYGKDHPFDLYFIPVSSSSFARAKVEWRKIDESAFPVPNFPPLRKWEEFVDWKDSLNNGTRSLIEWEENNFDRIINLERFYQDKDNTFQERNSSFKRYTVVLPELPEFDFKDKYGSYFLLDFADKEAVSIKFYKNEFETGLKNKGFAKEINFSFSIFKDKFERTETGRKIYKSSAITAGKSINNKMISRLSRTLRFPTMQIWNMRSCLESDAEIPQFFRDKIPQVKQSLSFLLNNPEVQKQDDLWNELLLFACVMHSDCIDITSEFINGKLNRGIIIPDNLKEKERNCFQFGYFIDDAKTEIQKKVFDWALDFGVCSEYELCSFKLQVLTIALWRNEEILKLIPFETMQILFNQVITAIKREYDKINGRKLKQSLLNPIRSHLELLCALIRSRTFEKDYQDMFSPFNSGIQDLISFIENLYDWIKQSEWEPPVDKRKTINKDLYARQIKFNLSDSENSFLDYLLLWLDGQKSTEMPKIESATRENGDDDYDKDFLEEE